MRVNGGRVSALLRARQCQCGPFQARRGINNGEPIDEDCLRITLTGVVHIIIIREGWHWH